MPNQQITGNNNVQVSHVDGSVNVFNGPVHLNPNNPNLVKCPACGHLVSYQADVCPACFDNLLRRREIAHRRAVDSRKYKVFFWLVVIGFLGWVVSSYLPSYKTEGGIVTVSAIVVAIMLAKEG